METLENQPNSLSSNTEMPNIGNRISAILLSRKMTATKLSQKCGESVSYLSRLMNKHTPNPGFRSIWNIAQSL